MTLTWIPLFRYFGKTRHRIFWDFQDSSQIGLPNICWKFQLVFLIKCPGQLLICLYYSEEDVLLYARYLNCPTYLISNSSNNPSAIASSTAIVDAAAMIEYPNMPPGGVINPSLRRCFPVHSTTRPTSVATNNQYDMSIALLDICQHRSHNNACANSFDSFSQINQVAKYASPTNILKWHFRKPHSRRLCVIICHRLSSSKTRSSVHEAIQCSLIYMIS